MNILKLKALIQKISEKKNQSDEETLSYYFLDNIIDKINTSEYRQSLSLRGGYIIYKLTGIDLRKTLDLNIDLKDPTKEPVNQIFHVLKMVFIKNSKDDITYDISELKENSDPYVNTRYSFTLTCSQETYVQRFKICVSLNDVYARDAVDTKLKSVFLENNLEARIYTTEAIISEKIDNMYHRGTIDYSCEQYCDFHAIYNYKRKPDFKIIRNYINDCYASKNDDFQYKKAKEIMKELKSDEVGLVRWRAYLKKYPKIKFIDLVDILDEINYVLLKAAGMYSRKAWRSSR